MATRDPSDLLGAVAIVAVLAIMLAIAARFALARQKDLDALADRLGLGPHDSLPEDFPTYVLDRFHKWENGRRPHRLPARRRLPHL